MYTSTTECRNKECWGEEMEEWKLDRDWIERFTPSGVIWHNADMNQSTQFLNWVLGMKTAGSWTTVPSVIHLSAPSVWSESLLTNSTKNSLSFSHLKIRSKQVFPFNIPRADWLFELCVASNLVNVRGLKLIPTSRCCFPLRSPDGIALALGSICLCLLECPLEQHFYHSVPFVLVQEIPVIIMGVLIAIAITFTSTHWSWNSYIQLKEERSHVERRGQLNIITALRNEGHRVKTIAY